MVLELKRVKWIASGLCAAALLVTAAPATAQDNSPVTDQHRADYQTIYGEKLSSVKRTRSESDDRTLAREMMAFASQSDNDPGVQCLIYIDVLTLASNAAEMRMMNEAATLLHQRWPNQDAVSPEELMQLAARGYRSVDRRDRQEQGEHYINLLIDLADRVGQTDDTELAANIFRLAGTVAGSIDSEQDAFIKDKIKRLAATSETNRRIKMLTLSIEKNPQNRPVAKELVTLLVTKRSDLATALKYVTSTSDPELIDLVQQCAKGIKQANAATALRVGDWYAALAEDERDEQALALLEKANAWYERFISLYTREDALAEHVKNKHSMVQLKLEQLGSDTSTDAKRVGRWVSLIAPPFNLKDNTHSEADLLETNQGEIAIDDGMFNVPLPKANSYEVKITMTTPEPKEEYENRSIEIGLPIGDDRFVRINLYCRNGIVAKFSHIEGDMRIKDELDRTDKKIQYTLQVSQTEDQTAVAILYNGNMAIAWKGTYDQLHEREEDDIRYLPLKHGYVMDLRALTLNQLHAIEFRTRD